MYYICKEKNSLYKLLLMKKYLNQIIMLLALALPFNGYAQQVLYGDVNGDLEVNIADINTVIDLILS